MARQRVAVIGSGVSGMTAAYRLRKEFEVTVFEADSRLGGHVDSRYPEPGRPVDMAFMVFSATYYPQFTQLLDELEVATRPADMSTEVTCADCGFAQRSDDPVGLGGLPQRPPRVSREVWEQYGDDVERFVPALQEAARDEPDTTMAAFLHKRDFSDYFARHFLHARLWGWFLSDVGAIPVGFLAQTLQRYGFLDGPEAFATWRVIANGSADYIARIAETLHSVRTSTPVRTVERSARGITVRDATGCAYRFDKAVLAVPAPQALALLADPTPEQRTTLGALTYTPLDAVLHTDRSLFPDGRGESGINIQLSCANPHLPPPVANHQNMDALWGRTSSEPLYVTYAPVPVVSPSTVRARGYYAHPSINGQYVAAQRRLPELSDEVLAFAGAYHGDGFHESGCAAGLAAARTLAGEHGSARPGTAGTGRRVALEAPEGSQGTGSAIIPDRPQPLAAPSWHRPHGLGTSAAHPRPGPQQVQARRGDPAKLRIPELWCPIPPAIHHQAEEVEEHLIQWLIRFGYITSPEEEQAARACEYGMLGARVFPRGPFEVTSFGAELIVCTFLLDDEYMERAAMHGRPLDYARNILKFTQILREPDRLPGGIPEGEVKYHAGLQDLAQRWRRMVPSEQMLRWRAGIEEYFMATGPEVIYQTLQTQPTLEEYISLRESSVLQRSACFVIVEMSGQAPLPGHLFCEPRVQRIARTASRIIAWTNDILSGPRELLWPGALNLIAALAEEYDCTYQEALDLAAHMHTEETRIFLNLVDEERRRGCDPRIDRYLTGIAHWIRGNLDWSRTTNRYRAGATATGPQTFGE
ncbi:terpene synthase family protein [Streptomyces olivaceiscleroticus]|uniref:Amine oxidase domain-containing protein n=1 Tax=Streptomyces olivaceiscleroticus TaxID=68245 RepID=A0ABP3JFK8_9ACTN